MYDPSMRAWLLLFPALASTGCVALPFVTPPARVSATFLTLDRPLPAGGDTAAHVEIGVHPASVIPSVRGRRLDLGIGYGFISNEKSFVHAPYIGLEARPFVYPFGKTAVVHAGSAVKSSLLFDDTGKEAGFGGSAQLLVEMNDYVAGSFGGVDNSGGIAGVGGGELGIGFHVEMFAMRYHETNVWGAGIGVDLRLPASVGILFAWLTPKK